MLLTIIYINRDVVLEMKVERGPPSSEEWLMMTCLSVSVDCENENEDDSILMQCIFFVVACPWYTYHGVTC